MAYFTGTPDNDTYTGGAGNDGITGVGGDDVLSGAGGLDTLFGGDGHDWIDGGSGDDIMGGGLGNDTFIVDSVADTVLEGTSQGIDLVRASVSFSLAGRQIEYLTLTGVAHINATGNGFNNQLTGNDGNNVLDGGIGADILTGGLGDDTYYVDHIGDKVVEAHLQGTDTIYSTVSYSLFGRAVENLILTGAALAATGNSLGNQLTGNSSNNVLDGGTGVDTLTGGLGDDTYYVDSGSDKVIEIVGEGFDLVVSSVNRSLSGTAAEALRLTGTAAINGTGNGLDNSLTGNDGSNLLSGGNGNDTLDGGIGADTMNGGNGNDVIYIDQAGDVFDGGKGIDTVVSAFSLTLAYEMENLTLSGEAGLSGTGNVHANLIIGNSGNNLLSGGMGHDTLYGLGGSDTLQAATGWDDLYGGDGDDVLRGGDHANWLDGGPGDDYMVGGWGGDVYIVDSLGDVVFEDDEWEDHIDWVQSWVSFTFTYGRLDNLTLLGTDDIDGTGNDWDNRIAGNAGINVLTGGRGNDTYVVQNEEDVVIETGLYDEEDQIQSYVTYSLAGLGKVENIYLMGNADINATGNNLDNLIYGNSGVNVLTGGKGNDYYWIYNIASTVVELSGQGTDSVSTSFSYVLGENLENLSVGGGDTDGTGNALDNRLSGSRGSNHLDGGYGNDTLYGNGGSDYFVFGLDSGKDEIGDLNEGGAKDWIDVSAYTHGVVGTVTQSGAHALIDLGGGNQIKVLNMAAVEVRNSMIW